MPIVEVPNVGEVEFPDSMSQEDIEGVLRKQFPSTKPTKPSIPDVPVNVAQYVAGGGPMAGLAMFPPAPDIPRVEGKSTAGQIGAAGVNLLSSVYNAAKSPLGLGLAVTAPASPVIGALAGLGFGIPAVGKGLYKVYQYGAGVGNLQTGLEGAGETGLGALMTLGGAKGVSETLKQKGLTGAKDQIESTSRVSPEQQGVSPERPAESQAQAGTPQRGGEGEQPLPQPAEVSQAVEKSIQETPPSGVAGEAQPSAGPGGATMKSPVPAGEIPQAIKETTASGEKPQVGGEPIGGVLDFIESQADKARERLKSRGTTFGSGPLHELPNIRDYAIIGAAKIARGAVDFAQWSGEMVKEFGDRIKPYLDNLFKASQDAVKEHTGIVERVRSVLSEADLPSKAITKAVSSQIGRSIESGVKTGERLSFGETAPRIGELQDKLNDSMSKAKALSVYFEGQEKGGAAGRKAATSELKLADKWLEADANNIRTSLTELAKGLPLEERGRFVKAIANATKRPPLVGGDPASMYRNAATVAARIGDRIEEVHKNDTIQEIRDTVSKALKSPGVDIGYKSRLLEAMRRVGLTKPTEATLSALKSTRDYLSRMEAQGKDVSIPKEVLDSLEVLEKTPIRDMPIGVLEALRDKVNQLDQLGRLKVQARKQVWEIEKGNKIGQLSKEATNPLNERPEFMPQPGDPRTFSMKLRNWINRRLNTGSMVDKALLPVDALFDLMGDAKGSYQGWLFKNVRNPLDLGFNEAQVARDRITSPLEKIIKDNKLGERESERIGVYAAVAQEGGLERLVEMGVKPETISNILKTITPAELNAYRAMRSAMDSTLPEIQKLMHELYNIDVKPVPEYFPMPRDWNRFEPEPTEVKGPKFGQEMDFDELSGWKQMLGDFMSPKTTKTERGFTIERQPNAQTPIKLNAFDVFFQHINDVTYLLKTQRDLKMIGEMVRSDEFALKYGKVGQNIVTSWLDTVARQGKIGGFRRIPFLDELRRRTSAGVIGFRLASQFVHLSNVPLAIWRAGGPQWYKAGLGEALSQRGQAFLRQNFAETFSRGGGEPALVEAAQSDLSVFGKTIIPKSVSKASFAIARQIDRYNSQASTLGIYLRLLSEKGKDVANYDKIPVDKEAQARALVLSRRAVASPLPKDVSSSLSRGAITGGNISVGRTIFQFQNIFQDQWSNIRHDLIRSGIIEKNPKVAAVAFVALAATILSEMGIRETSKAIIDAVTGNNKKKKEEDLKAKIAMEAARRIPFGGQLTSQILYGESGVPSLDSLVGISKAVHGVAVAKKDATKQKNLVKAVAGAAQVAGVPGASQVGELIQKSQ